MVNSSLVLTCIILVITGYGLWNNSANSAEVYKWVDAKGVVHFGDRPSEPEAKKLIINTDVHQDAEYHEQLDKQTKMLEIYEEERQQEDLEKEKISKDKKLRQHNCTLAKNNLNSIKTASYLYQATDDPRNPRILTSEERSTAAARAEADVKQWCK